MLEELFVPSVAVEIGILCSRACAMFSLSDGTECARFNLCVVMFLLLRFLLFVVATFLFDISPSFNGVWDFTRLSFFPSFAAAVAVLGLDLPLPLPLPLPLAFDADFGFVFISSIILSSNARNCSSNS